MNVIHDEPEIQRRIAKLKQRLPKIVDQGHLNVILSSFPLDRQSAIFNEIKLLITKFDPVFDLPITRQNSGFI